jgi:hypothetical protein
MPCVLAAADFKPDVQIVEGTQEDEEEWDYLPLGRNFKGNGKYIQFSLDDNRQLGIKTAGLEDKLTACEMIVCFSRELKEDFANYVERVLNMVKKFILPNKIMSKFN